MTKSYYLIPAEEISSSARVYVIRVQETPRDRNALVELYGLCAIRGWYLQIRCPESIQFIWRLAANYNVHTYMVCPITSALKKLRRNLQPTDGRLIDNLWLERIHFFTNYKDLHHD